ncbi:MAG TPA: response regulator [Azospirillum sp.]|nr:response regulator [Azospirillum sp.]
MSAHVHVIVADDEILVATTLADILEEAGYRVTVTHNGLEALEAEQRDPADLLLTDLRMPRLDGIALIGRIRAQRPELPIVVMTGYSESLPVAEPGRLVVLRKPFAPDAVIETIRALLGPAPGR